ncbi:B12-binding domain-containing radical SAM protein [Alicyclobacillus pomorum]|uniref:B12-binding domain-containing radical SAM protein n=1 Tax=Alicyclobacillus pomorum TaxID=204470 RepID=UPI000403EE20|nr:B12-binding domain-containing radical SAM protein [Alicyclobacillus pomorum]
MNIVLTTLNAKYIHSSLALRYLRAYCRRDFPDVQLVEFTIKDPATHIVADLYRRRPDVIAFSTYIWNIEETIPVVKMLKQVLPNTRIVLGGPEVSYDVHHWIRRLPEVDFIVVGEGEATFHELLSNLRNGGDGTGIAGTAYLRGDKVVMEPPRAKLDLATVPSPYETDEDLHGLTHRIVYFESSRGCPFSCQFCLSSIESGVRYFPMERVKRNLLRLIHAGVRTIKFVDRTFNLKKDYAMELFRFLIEHRRDTVFQFEITGDILPPDVTDFLAENAPPGAFRFEIGVQSTNDLTNTLVRRRQNFDKLRRTIETIKNSGRIVQHLDLIAGLPEEDYTSFRKTFNDVFALEPEELQLGFLKMLRGTGLRARASQHGYIYQEHAPYEILGNNVLSFDDILRIKQVEDVLEKYWNDGRLRNTVRYLAKQVFPSPFDFFQAFGTYWDEQGWSRIGHQLKDLFLRLHQFLQNTCSGQELQAAQSLMKLDYLLSFRVRPHEVWWGDRVHKSDVKRLLASLVAHPEALGAQFQALRLTADALDRHTVVEVVPFHLQSLLSHGILEETPTLLLVYYAPGLGKGEHPPYFLTPLEALETPLLQSVLRICNVRK